MKKLFKECLHKNLSNKSGIYIIKCNEHTYIGSSCNLYYRLKRHVSDLNNLKHSNKFLQNLYNKYGSDIIIFDIIEYCSIETLIIRETYYIKTMSPDINHDLNPVKRTFKKESIEKISESLKQLYKSGLKNPFSKEVHRYKPNGEYIDSHESCCAAGRKLNLNGSKISKAASGKGSSSGGYLWSYEKVDKLIKNINQSKRVRSLDINNNVINTWLSINDLCNDLKISHSATSLRIKKGNYYNGLKYKFI